MGVAGLIEYLTNKHPHLIKSIDLFATPRPLHGHRAFVDAQIYIVRYALRSGKIPDIAHQFGFMHRTLLGATRLQPVFVMDNEARSPLKDLYTTAAREDTRNRLNRNENYRELMKDRGRIHAQLHEEFLLRGMRLITAPPGFEAEQACASLAAKAGGFVVSEDSDSLVFGAPLFLKGFPNKLQIVNLEQVLETLGISRTQLIDVSLMSGCDFASKIPGVGIAKAIEAVKKFGCIENFIEHRKFTDKNFHLYSFFVESFDFQRGRDVFQAALDDATVRSLLARKDKLVSSDIALLFFVTSLGRP